MDLSLCQLSYSNKRINEYRRLQLFGHVARGDVEKDHARALKAMIGGPPRDWKRPVGRPRQTWLRVVTSDLLPLNLGPNAA